MDRKNGQIRAQSVLITPPKDQITAQGSQTQAQGSQMDALGVEIWAQGRLWLTPQTSVPFGVLGGEFLPSLPQGTRRNTECLPRVRKKRLPKMGHFRNIRHL